MTVSRRKSSVVVKSATPWNDKAETDCRDQIRQSVLSGPVTKRLVGIGQLTVKPVADYSAKVSRVSTEPAKVYVCRDEARIEVTADFARQWDGRNIDSQETRDAMHLALIGLQSTAYSVDLWFRGHNFTTLYPHTSHDGGVCKVCAK